MDFRDKWLLGFLLVVITYVLSHSMMLFVPGIWWDDCGLFNMPPDKLSEWHDEFNNPFLREVNYIVLGYSDNILSQTLFYRLFPFFTGLLSVLCVFIIVKKVTCHYGMTVITSLIAASLCMDKTTPILITCTYQASLALFMLGLVFFVFDYYKDNISFRILASFLWFLSLCIWRSPIITIVYVLIAACLLKVKFNFVERKSYLNILRIGLSRYWIFLFVIIVFAVLFKTILAPQGSYAQYYSLNPLTIIASPFTAISNSFRLLVQTCGEILLTFGSSHIIGTILFLFFCVIYFAFVKLKFKESYVNNMLLMLAFGMLVSTVYPHVLVHEINFALDFGGWTSRFASMALFPVAFILAYLIQLLSKRIRPILLGLIISGSIMLSNLTAFGFIRGWARNEAIVEAMTKCPYIEGKKIMYFSNADNYSVFQNEPDRFYEIEACARLAYGPNTKTECLQYNPGISASTLKPDFAPDYYMFIDRRDDYNSLILCYRRLFRPSKYRECVKNMLLVRFEKVDRLNL